MTRRQPRRLALRRHNLPALFSQPDTVSALAIGDAQHPSGEKICRMGVQKGVGALAKHIVDGVEAGVPALEIRAGNIRSVSGSVMKYQTLFLRKNNDWAV